MPDEYESGPYCKHWSEPGSCSDCARELLADELQAKDRKIAVLAAALAGMLVEAQTESDERTQRDAAYAALKLAREEN